jgi:tetratricopeptide (TPR) repeat protein
LYRNIRKGKPKAVVALIFVPRVLGFTARQFAILVWSERMRDELFQWFNAGVSASLSAHECREKGDDAQAHALEQQAAAAFDKILAVEPTHAGALAGKAMCLAQLGRTREAATWFQRAADVEPQNPENYRQLGLCHAELGDLDAASTASRRAEELEGGAEYLEHTAIELYNLGGHIMTVAAGHRDASKPTEEQQCYRQAQGMFSLALEIDPDNVDAEEALELVEQSLSGRPPVRKPWWRFW